MAAGGGRIAAPAAWAQQLGVRVRRAAARVLRKSRIAPVLAAARKAAADATERARSAEVALRELTAQADSRAAEAFSGDFW